MMQRFFVEAGQLVGETINFAEQQTHQIRHVLRLRAGDQVRVFDGSTLLDYLVELKEPERGEVIGHCQQAQEPRTKLVAYPALLQRDKFESVLQKLTEVGVAAIAPVITARGLVREPPDERRQVRWHAILREAAEQSGRGVVPALRPTQTISQAIAGAEGTRVMAYEGERRGQLKDALAPRPETVSLFVGPEGGFTQE